MIKKLLLIALSGLLSKSAISQSFSLYYPFSAVTNSSGATDPTPAPTATGVTSGAWTAVNLSANASGPGYFSFTTWPTGATNSVNTTFTGALDVTKYYELTLTPQGSYMVTLNNMSFGASRSGTGARHWAVRTNKDGYTANIAATYTALNAAASATTPVIAIENGNTFFWTQDANNTGTGAVSFATNNICNVNFSGATYSNQTSPFIIRVYAWDAEAAGGTMRMDTVVVNGTATFSLGVGLPTISHDLNAKIKLYPNPASNGVVTVEALNSASAKLEIVNVLGAVVAVKNTEADSKLTVDVSTLPEGTYFVKITSGNKVSTEKLIIAK